MPMILALNVLRCGTKQTLGQALDVTAGHDSRVDALVTPRPLLFLGCLQQGKNRTYTIHLSPDPAGGSGP